MKILVTGGAGFIGSHITDRLVKQGHQVTILDNLSSTQGKKPDYLNTQAEFIQGDVMDQELLKKLIPNFDAIYHEAASVGIAQSNYEIREFVDNNCSGTASILQAIVETKSHPRFILSASNTTYGEGMYSCKQHGSFHPEIRSQEYVDEHGFEITCPICKTLAAPIPTPEKTELNCNSIYALTKKFQEESAILLGKMYGFPVILLKYFNVFGPRQSLSNPYTGVSAIFMSRVKSGNIPSIYEDGLQTRDFVSIEDVIEANMIALENPKADYQVFNVGSGNPITIIRLAEEICKLYGKEPKYEINSKFRKGDIRHCIADNSKIKQILGWTPKVSFEEGLKRVYDWAILQESRDDFDKADRELKEKGLA
jgi:dTDP-L-rhamnose 4-epimerase